MSNDFQVHARQAIERLSVDILLHRKTPRYNEYLLPANTVVSRLHDSTEIVEPTLNITFETAQSLLQALWDLGYRPANGSSGKAEVDALQKHIAFAERVAITMLNPLMEARSRD